MNYFSTIFGLITKNDPTTENGGLFFLHYLILKIMLGLPISDEDKATYIEKMNNSVVEYGLYKRSKIHNERTVSQDEITGFVGASDVLKTSHKIEIWSYLKSHGGNYPATGKNKMYNPASYYAWSVLSDDENFFLAPFYTINLLISTNKAKENTSSKLIYLSELYLMKGRSKYSNALWAYYIWRMKLMYGKKWINELFKIYFGSTESQDFPLLELSSRI